MKVRMNREDLLTAIQRVQGVVEKRNAMPILANILLEAKPEGLEVLATDLELGLRGVYGADVQEPGSITLSARKLYEILRELREPEVRMTVAENSWVTIESGRSQFRMVGLPSQDFPDLPAIEREGLVPLPGSGFLDLIRRTIFSVADHDTRYVLNGLLVTILKENGRQKIRLVATDGHRLALAEHVLDHEVKLGNATKELSVIIPKKAAAEMRRLLEREKDEYEPLIGFTRTMVLFRKSGLALTSRVMEGTYPNYQQVIPRNGAHPITVNRADLEGALRRVSLLSTTDYAYAVKCTIGKDRISLHSSSPDFGEAHEECPATFEGPEFSTGFNAHYLLDVLAVIPSDTVTLQMETPLSPCLICEAGNPNFKAVVMPLRT